MNHHHRDEPEFIDLDISVWHDPLGRHIRFTDFHNDVSIEVTLGEVGPDRVDAQAHNTVRMSSNLPALMSHTLEKVNRDLAEQCTCGDD